MVFLCPFLYSLDTSLIFFPFLSLVSSMLQNSNIQVIVNVQDWVEALKSQLYTYYSLRPIMKENGNWGELRGTQL